MKLSRKAKRSLKQIDKIFDRMYQRKILISDKKQNVKLSTKEHYASRVKTFFREVYREFNISDIAKVKDEHFEFVINQKIENFKNGKTSEASNIKSTLAALKAFNKGVQETNFYSYSRKFSIGDIDETREILREEKIFRRSGYSPVLRATQEQSKKVIQNIQETGYETDTRQIAAKVSFISMKSGGRVTNTLALKKRDFRRINENKGEITFFKDKGGLTRTVRIDNELLEFLERETANKREDQYLFESRRKNGQLKSRDQVRKEVSKIVREAGAEFERTNIIKEKDKNGKEVQKEIDMHFTTHSFRKAFALERTKDYYLALSSKNNIEKILNEKFEQNQKIEEKYYTQLNRINGRRKEEREMTREELAIFLTSVDLGHFRTDVMKMYYCNTDDVKRHYALD